MNKSKNKSSGNSAPAIVWFREDLRVEDNLALNHAAATGAAVLPIYVHDTVSEGIRPPGSAQRWMLHHALAALNERLSELGSPLIIRSGPADPVLADIVEGCNPRVVTWNRRIGNPAQAVDGQIAHRLRKRGIEVKVFNGNLMHDPASLRTSEESAYKVYSPFWRAFEREIQPRAPIRKPESLSNPDIGAKSETLNSLRLIPEKPDWAGGLRNSWEVGERGGKSQLTHFVGNGLRGYASGRDMPSKNNISMLSPYLRWGMLSPFQVWQAVSESEAPSRDKIKFLKELGWREFSYHLLHQFPDLASRNFHSKFDRFPWRSDDLAITAWKAGKTGYPFVDAGMRELWHTGYMHNRVRMVTASFLVKHLLVDWRVGEEWFWDTLVDGDPANNPASWQWVAGSGADAAPYFRIFNPVLQSRKFDENGEYIRKWVPELSELSKKFIHAPWEADEEVLKKAGICLGETYPHPITSHKNARERALEAFASIRKEE